jgi:hypothetical protein
MTQKGMAHATTREEVRNELASLFSDVLRQEMHELSRHVQKVIHEELRKFFIGSPRTGEGVVALTRIDDLRSAANTGGTGDYTNLNGKYAQGDMAVKTPQGQGPPELKIVEISEPSTIAATTFPTLPDHPLAPMIGERPSSGGPSPGGPRLAHAATCSLSAGSRNLEPLKFSSNSLSHYSKRDAKKTTNTPKRKAASTFSSPGAVAASTGAPEVNGKEAWCEDDPNEEQVNNTMVVNGEEINLRASVSRQSRLQKGASFSDKVMPVWAQKRRDSVQNEQSFLADLVKSETFDYIMGIFLMLNAVTIGVQVNHMANLEKDAPPPFSFRVIDVCFCVVFTSELLSRLSVHRRNLYSMKGWQWNVFDTVVVAFQIVDEMTMLFLTGTDIQAVIENLGVLRMLRLGRILRLIRMVRLIPELKSMVYLIAASMWSFFWTLMLLILMMFCVSVFFTEAGCDLAKEWERDGQLQQAKDMRQFWGSVSQSMLTLFMAITGGDDWNNYVVVFDSTSSYVMNTLFFSLYIAFAVLVMLNLVTGVFVEGAQRIIREDKDSELVKQVCKFFASTEEEAEAGSASHSITWEDFHSHIDAPEMDYFFEAVDISKVQAQNLFGLLDADESGTITVDEFVRGCMRLKGPARSVDLANLCRDFQVSTCRFDEKLSALENLVTSFALGINPNLDPDRQPAFAATF